MLCTQAQAHLCLIQGSLSTNSLVKPPLNSSFNRVTKPHTGIFPRFTGEHAKWEKSLNQTTVISNQAAVFNRYVKKVHDDMQDHIKTLYNEMISKGKLSQKTDKVLTELRDMAAFQQNIIFTLGKSMQHMVDTIFVQASNMTLLRRDSYLDYFKPGVKPDTWCALRNSPVHHTVLFRDAVIGKAEEETSKSDVDHCPPNPVWVPAEAAAVVVVSNLTAPTGSIAGWKQEQVSPQDTE